MKNLLKENAFFVIFLFCLIFITLFQHSDQLVDLFFLRKLKDNGKCDFIDNSVLSENFFLKEKVSYYESLLGESLSSEFYFVDSSVISLSPFFVQDFLVLNKGKKHGVKDGCIGVFVLNASVDKQVESFQPAYKFFLGVVDVVKENSSNLKLAQFVRQSLVLRAQRSGSLGVLKSDGERIFIDNVPAEDSLFVGETVVTEVSEGIPDNFYVGTIEKVFSKENTPTKSGLIGNTILDLKGIKFVRIYCRK